MNLEIEPQAEMDELRAALNVLIDIQPGVDKTWVDMLNQRAYRKKEVTHPLIETCNAARVVARFLGWDDVLEGDIV